MVNEWCPLCPSVIEILTRLPRSFLGIGLCFAVITVDNGLGEAFFFAHKGAFPGDGIAAELAFRGDSGWIRVHACFLRLGS